MRKLLTDTDSATNENLTPSTALKSLVESYITNKQKESEYKKAASAENTEIKELMTVHKLDRVDTDLGSAILPIASQAI